MMRTMNEVMSVGKNLQVETMILATWTTGAYLLLAGVCALILAAAGALAGWLSKKPGAVSGPA